MRSLGHPREAGRIAGLAAILLALMAGQAAAAPLPLEKVALQLKWRHQFQFAGYYIAAEKGYYRDAGLDVEIREATHSIRYTPEVLEGRAQYGISNTDLLVDRAKGEKVVVLAVIFQHSPLVLLSLKKSALSSPRDFIGKTVMISKDAETEIISMFSNESIPRSAVRFIEHSWEIEDLVSGKAEAVSAYLTNEVLTLEDLGYRATVTKPLTYGIDFYGDCLFTSEAELRSHPARTAAFLAASLKGWEYAMDHVEEACDLILAKYSRQKGRAALLAEAGAMENLMVHRFVPIGFMNPGRWRHIGDTYAKLGMVPPGYSLKGFLYDPKPQAFDPRTLKIAIALLAAAMGVAIAYILILRAFNARLALEVASRTAGLEELNRTLSAEVLERKEKERIIALSLAEKEVLLKEVHHRVKNNLQIIASIVNMQIEAAPDIQTRDMLQAVRSRVYGMALVHERLYGSSDLSRIDLDDYLRALVGEIVAAYARPGLAVATAVDARGIAFTVERAIPLGLVVGEIVSNSMKHAFAKRSDGRIDVSLRGEDGSYELRIADNGEGSMKTGEAGASGSRAGAGIGLQLVEALSSQLGGSLSVETSGGFVYRLSFT